jgi:protein-tyrosine phosphatase
MDDGSSDLGETRALIQMELSDSIHTIVFTPHFDPFTDFIDEFVEKRNARCNELMDNLHLQAFNIKLIKGSETFYSELLFYFNAIPSLCIGDTHYILLEFQRDKKFDKKFFTAFEAFINKYDVVPIIAHAEVYESVRKNCRILSTFRSLGCMIQVNASAIINSVFDPNNIVIDKLFEKSLVDIVASDCHNIDSRPPRLKKAMKIVYERYGADTFNMILSNQYLIAENKYRGCGDAEMRLLS